MAKSKPPSETTDPTPAPDGVDDEGRETWQGEPHAPPPETQPSASDAAPEPTPVEVQVINRTLSGWKRNPEDKRDHSARPLLGAPTNLPAEWFGIVAYLIAALDQGGSSGCVGFAIAAAIMIRLRMLNLYVAAVSEWAIYAWARMMGKTSKDDPILDDGCMPRSAMEALRLHGVPLESDWPFDEATVNTELPWDVQQKASAARITKWARLDSDGIGLIHDIMHALVQGFPVVFGTFVDTAFMNVASADSLQSAAVVRTMNLRDSRGGGHMMCIVGYRTNSDGQIEFLVLNSWGLTFGYRGLVWIHQDVMLDPESGDFHMMQVALGGPEKKQGEEKAAA